MHVAETDQPAFAAAAQAGRSMACGQVTASTGIQRIGLTSRSEIVLSDMVEVMLRNTAEMCADSNVNYDLYTRGPDPIVVAQKSSPIEFEPYRGPSNKVGAR